MADSCLYTVTSIYFDTFRGKAVSEAVGSNNTEKTFPDIEFYPSDIHRSSF